MSKTDGLRVTVDGDLSPEILNKIVLAVRRAVLDEVAKLDISPPLREAEAENSRAEDSIIPIPPLLGLWLQPTDETTNDTHLS